MSELFDLEAVRQKLAALPIETYQASDTVLAEGSTTGDVLVLKAGAVEVVKGRRSARQDHGARCSFRRAVGAIGRTAHGGRPGARAHDFPCRRSRQLSAHRCQYRALRGDDHGPAHSRLQPRPDQGQEAARGRSAAPRNWRDPRRDHPRSELGRAVLTSGAGRTS
jgi:hypothetical protein